MNDTEEDEGEQRRLPVDRSNKDIEEYSAEEIHDWIFNELNKLAEEHHIRFHGEVHYLLTYLYENEHLSQEDYDIYQKMFGIRR